MTKTGDRLVFDFTGSSVQSRHAINCTKWASLGGLFAPLFPLLCYDITWNEGVIRPVEMIAPEGSIVNCTRPAPVSVATVAAIQSVNNAACATIGKMLAASDRYREQDDRGLARQPLRHLQVRPQPEGRRLDRHPDRDFRRGGRRALLRDGVDIGGEIPNPISRMANVETVEANFPIRYLFRRRMKDSGGPGRWRGGHRRRVRHRAAQGARRRFGYVVIGQGHPPSDGEGCPAAIPARPAATLWSATCEVSDDHAPKQLDGNAGRP